jgi:hypothetical protein
MFQDELVFLEVVFFRSCIFLGVKGVKGVIASLALRAGVKTNVSRRVGFWGIS